MALALSGCGSGSGTDGDSDGATAAESGTAAAGGDQSATSGSLTQGSDDAGPSAPAAETTAADTGSSGATAASSTGSQAGGAQTGPTACTAGSLSAEVAPADGGGAAGSVYWDVTLTNAGATDCTLTGYPGVSFADTSGTQVGAPADREPTDATIVTLIPGASAVASLKVMNPDVIAGCTPVTASSVLIYPPDQTESLNATADVTVCQEQASTAIGVFQPVS